VPRGREGGDGAVHAARFLRLVIAVAVLAGGLAAAARADGDPASDYLLGRNVFLPPEAKFPAVEKARFAAYVDAVNKAGFKIRVALITSSYDMGSVTALYKKPRQYAKFLSIELSFVYHQRLLIVMPNGFGFHWPRHDSAAAYRLLSRVPIKSGDAGLLAAAQAAIQRLTGAGGVDVAVPRDVATPAHRNSHDRLVIIALTVGALFAVAATRYLLRPRRVRSSRP
jgi:hypothetical protein